MILAFEANSALTHENETKIVKITHIVILGLSDDVSIIFPHSDYNKQNKEVSMMKNPYTLTTAATEIYICLWMS